MTYSINCLLLPLAHLNKKQGVTSTPTIFKYLLNKFKNKIRHYCFLFSSILVHYYYYSTIIFIYNSKYIKITLLIVICKYYFNNMKYIQ